MANVKIHCPNCHQEYDVDEAALGHEAECEACKKTFVLQADAASTEPSSEMKIDGGSAVEADDKEKLANLYTLARREFKIGNYKDAVWYYKKIMTDDPDNWEPAFVMNFIKAGHGTQKWENIADEVDMFSKELDETIRLIEKTTDANERNDLLSDMVLPSSLEVANIQMDGMKQILDSIMQLKNCKNIILRNLTFKAAGAYDIDGNDNLTLATSTYIWIDHCDFQDGVDGNFDCTKSSDNICVSWCRFRYLIAPKSGGSGGADDHRYSDLWGGADKEDSDGKLNTTFVSCWWDKGCRERMPRVRFGKVHLVNCYWGSDVTSYCIGIGLKAQIYVQNGVFNGKGSNYKFASSSGENDYSIKISGCKGQSDYSGSKKESIFTPSYSLTPYSVDQVVSAVTNSSTGAGPTLQIKEGGTVVTDIFEVSPVETTPQYFDVYTLTGVKVRTKATSLSGLPRGIYIANGRKKFVK